MKRTLWIAGSFILAGMASAEVLNGYHIGNSLTADSQPAYFSSSYTLQGKTSAVGYHIDSSQSAYSISLNPGGVGGLDATPPAPYGAWTNALPKYAWNYVSVQSYNQWNQHPPNIPVTGQEEVTGFTTLFNSAKSNPANAGTKFYIYEAWPQSNALSYVQQWTAPYTNLSQPMTFSRAYFDLLYKELKKDTPNLFLIPVGDVLAALHTRLAATPVDGLDSVYDLYRDTYHMGNNGRYIAHMTVLATVLGSDPAGMTLPTFIGNLPSSPQFKALADEVIWDTVTSMPETGVVPEPGTLALVGLGAAGVLLRRLRKTS